MLANHLGQETFLKGVSNYLKTHAYGNAKTGKASSHADLSLFCEV
jgi:aminopeptidase N